MPPRPSSATMRYRSATMAPGTNLPPPIGSEEVSTGLLEGADRGAGRGGVAGTSGARVSGSDSSIPTSPITVASGSAATAVPHLAQNLALSVTALPQDVQY